MLRNISWTSYIIFMVIALICYYTTLCLRYYRAEIGEILASRYKTLKKVNNKGGLKRGPTCTTNPPDLLPVVNQFASEIKTLLEQAAKNNLMKQEIIYALQQIAKGYQPIRGSAYHSYIDNYILLESSKYSSVHLKEEDLNMLWVM